MARNRVVVTGLRKSFRVGQTTVRAVEGVDLEVEAGELVALLGPSGCGKTTTLRCVAGLEKADAGEILFGDRLVFSAARRVNVPTEARQLGMVFQSYALWPHLSVRANVAYPLETRRLAKHAISEQVAEVLELVQCAHLADRFPGQLSGGQQQRVALARALVGKPSIMLFDEPLSNLDAKLREQMRFEIVDIQRRVGFTGIYVTHDQIEAMTVASRIVVMHAGAILQIGTPEEIYHRPADLTVAGFMGTPNQLPGKVLSANGGDTIEVGCPFGLIKVRQGRSRPPVGAEVQLCVRPEAVAFAAKGGENCWPASVDQVVFLGQYYAYATSLAGLQLRVYSHQRSGIAVGEQVYVHIPPESCLLFDQVGQLDGGPNGGARG